METINLPQSFGEALALAQRATCLNWSRDSMRLALTLDDHATDRRSCVTISLKRGNGEVRTLRGFNAAKNIWSEYVGAPVLFEFTHRRGEKAFRDWIAEEAVKATGSVNPACFSRYPQK